MNNSAMWGGRFSAEPHELVQKLSESVSFDTRLYKADIQGSIAHARALVKTGVLTDSELTQVTEALRQLEKDIDAGKVRWKTELEDVHMNIESLLTERIGDLGKKIHAGRSRNDQVVTDLRLYLKEQTLIIIELIRDFQRILIELARKYGDVIMPGFTHLQIAQPVLFSHHLMAYFEMLQRDKERFRDSLKRTDISGLGSAALAGSTYGQDREALAGELGFGAVAHNSIDAVSDRDFAVEFLAAAAIAMMHLSRFAEEIVIWMSPGFRYVNIGDEFTTGSSIMPQKRNPDVAELTRGKTGRIYGNLMALLTVMKSLPLSYNRDMQEDKEPVFDTIDTLFLVLPAFTGMIATLSVNRDHLHNCSKAGYSLATDLADYLTRKGVPFRDAHRITGQIVKYCEDSGKGLEDLNPEEMRQFVPVSVDLPDPRQLLTPETAVDSRGVLGGTAGIQVSRQLARAEKLVQE